MSYSEKAILLVFLLSLTACAATNAVPPDAIVTDMTGTVIRDPEQGLKGALEAYTTGDGSEALVIARQVREQYPDTPWYQRSLFLTEQALIKLDRADDADAVMIRVRSEYPVLGDYALFSLAEYHYERGRYTRAVALYEEVEKRYPKSALAARSAYRHAQALLESGAYAPAADAFEKILQNDPRSEFCADAGIDLGKALTAAGDAAGAIRAYRDVQIKCPKSSADQDAEKALAAFRSGGVDVPELTPGGLYERGKNLFRLYRFDKAVEAYTKLLALAPSFPEKPDILVRTGIAQYNLGRRAAAVTTLERMLKDYPSHPRIPEALFWLGKSYSKLGDRDRGSRAFRTILASYSGSEWADDALYLAGTMNREAGDLKKALVDYERLATEYPNSKFADSALWWKAWAYYGAGEYRKSELTLRELINRYPSSFLVKQALYWQGRAMEKMGDAAKAVSYYQRVQKRAPYTYYGYRASERLKVLDASNAPEIAEEDDIVEAKTVQEAEPICEYGPCPDDADADDGPPVWTDEALKTLSADPSFGKARELLYLNMKKEAAAELSRLQGRLPKKRGTLLGLSKTYFELGDYYRSLMLVLRHYERYLDGKPRETPRDFWLLAYPQGYWDSIVSYSRQYGQDPFFIAAIIRAESQFHAEALSPAGARGVMQVMPSTGAWVARNIRTTRFAPDMLYDSDTSIKIGTWYIGHLMRQFRGNALFTAAAYNAGPDAVSTWLDNMDRIGAEQDEFVEAIPFSETRGYVKKVMRNYAEYRRIYGKTDQEKVLLPALSGVTIGGPPVAPVEVKTP